jgi:hypothetical protein
MRSTHDRAIIAARASSLAAHRPSTVGTNPAMRPVQIIAPLRSADGGLVKGKRSKGRGPSTTQRDSTGKRSAWSRSPYTPRGGWR